MRALAVLLLLSLAAVGVAGLQPPPQAAPEQLKVTPLPDQPTASTPSPTTQSTQSTPSTPSTSSTPSTQQTLSTPSPRNANYEIDVRLDPDAKTLRARETIRWRNISGAPTSELQFHLYWNAWRNAESTWLRERRLAGTYKKPQDDAWSAIDVSSLRVRDASGAWTDLTGQSRFIAPDDGNARDRTVMTVPLGRPIDPDATLEAEVVWTSKIPRPFARTGYVGDYFFIAQWFPKLGVLEERGWNTHQFHAATEFFSDFGVYDVSITLPRRFIVGASGRVTQRSDNADGTTTYRYHGEDIHDFAWTASPDFIDLSQRFQHPTLPPVEMRLLLQPEHQSQADRYFTAAAWTLKHYGEWFGAYPYGHVTIIDPAFQSESDGMEYPTLFVGGTRWLAPAHVQTPESVTTHEFGHQWWYGLVATNEFEHAWMDEGFNTYSTARVLDARFNPNRVALRYFGGFVPWTFEDIPVSRLENDRLDGYRLNAEADAPWFLTFTYWPGTARYISYNKTAVWMHSLERQVGWPTMQRIMSTYFERWKFRHPKPTDFFAVVREVTGRGNVAFFDEVYRSSNTFDYGVQEFTSAEIDDGRTTPASPAGYRTTVVVRRYGEATFPIDVVTTFANGERVKESWDGQDRRVIYTYERPVKAATVQVDPDRVLLLDINYTNNSRTLAPRTRAASLKWSLKWMTWLEDLMLTYAFFS